jgi:hypothetical protein
MLSYLQSNFCRVRVENQSQQLVVQPCQPPHLSAEVLQIHSPDFDSADRIHLFARSDATYLAKSFICITGLAHHVNITNQIFHYRLTPPNMKYSLRFLPIVLFDHLAASRVIPSATIDAPPQVIQLQPPPGWSKEAIIGLCSIFVALFCCFVKLAWSSAWGQFRPVFVASCKYHCRSTQYMID